MTSPARGELSRYNKATHDTHGPRATKTTAGSCERSALISCMVRSRVVFSGERDQRPVEIPNSRGNLDWKVPFQDREASKFLVSLDLSVLLLLLLLLYRAAASSAKISVYGRSLICESKGGSVKAVTRNRVATERAVGILDNAEEHPDDEERLVLAKKDDTMRHRDKASILLHINLHDAPSPDVSEISCFAHAPTTRVTSTNEPALLRESTSKMFYAGIF